MMKSDQDTIDFGERERLKSLGYKEITKRNSEILELYRTGKTLQEIGNLFALTRERVRQIVSVTIKRAAANESILKGVLVDAEIFSDGIVKKRKLAQEFKKIKHQPKIIPKEKRWSMYYLSCRSCGTTSIPHVRKGLCEECLGIFRADRREDIIAKHDGKCDVCGKLRTDARLDYGRDLFITKSKGVLCRGCFRKSTGEVLGHHRNFEWSRYYQKCKKCATTTVPHVKKGLCENCCDIYSTQQRESLIKIHGGECDYCHIDRNTARAKQGRDLYVTKGDEVLVLCRGCFQGSARNRFFKKAPPIATD